MALNLHLLRIFAAVAENNNFSQAAKALYISQPAVSRAVQELEEQVGLPLLDRSHRALALTEAGALLYQYAQRLFAVEQAAETALEQFQGLERGHLAVGASQTTGTYLLPPLLSRFHQQYPGVRLSLEIANTQTVLEKLHTQPLDLAFVEGPVKDKEFLIVPWRTDRLVIIVPPKHPLLAKQPITLDQIGAEPYVQREVGSGTREVVDDVFQRQGLTLNVAIELSSNQAVKQAVSAGLGVSIVSDATITLEVSAGTLALLEVQGIDFNRTLTQVRLKGKPVSPAAEAFLRLLEEDQFRQ
ncbi:MAG TPA: selenium metabolism-associated LysR family transcriptional regulator [Phototrophicaceae bacterium]|nr:selenium metabolism-associated LysR family transcriptional regulator [Phototrophicaceae bacterium]